MKVLVIDDEEGIRDLFKEYLGILGHDADVAGDAAGGLGLLDERRYDLVLTDLVMPGMSGFALVQTIRRRHPELRIIVISGSADQFDIQQVEHANFGYLHKPVPFAQFRGAVCPDDGDARDPSRGAPAQANLRRLDPT